MLTFSDIPAWLGTRHEEAKEIGRGFRSAFVAVGSVHRFHAEALLDRSLFEHSASLVLDGVLRCSLHDGLVRLYEEGDVLMGVPPVAQINSEFAGELLVCDGERLRERAASDRGFGDRWIRLLELHAEIMHGLCGVYVRPDVQPIVHLERWARGDCIISEGDLSQDIYVMIDGEARVLYEGREVGIVRANELFGEMSFLIEQPRLATVVAMSECVVHRVRGEEFNLLLATRPSLAVDMARTMAWRITRLNQVVEAA